MEVLGEDPRFHLFHYVGSDSTVVGQCDGGQVTPLHNKKPVKDGDMWAPESDSNEEVAPSLIGIFPRRPNGSPPSKESDQEAHMPPLLNRAL